MSYSNNAPACQCGSCPPAVPRPSALTHAGRTAKTLPSALLSLGIAFFPKCPFCWAAYMSALGSLGLVKIPYLPWMLPVLMGLLALHLLLLLRQLRQGRYWPFVFGVLGAACILLGRSVLPYEKWLLLAGPGLLVVGSLLNSFSIPLPSFNKPQLTA
jgi:hypothetical protein